MSAPAPGSEVDICNLALARLGQPPIASIEGDDLPRPADIMARHYPMTRRRLLRGPRVYNFAKSYGSAPQDSALTPAFGFGAAYKLPNDFLRLLGLGDVTDNDDVPAALYDVVGRHIYTDEGTNGVLKLHYIKDEVLVGMWDALFVNLIRLELAKDTAYAFTLKPSLITQLDDELKDIRLEAGAVAGQEKPPRRITRSKYLTDRRLGGGGSRDTTRHAI
jgi:hypothetical protein